MSSVPSKSTERRPAGPTPRGRTPKLPSQLGPLRLRRGGGLRFVDDPQDSPEIWTDQYRDQLTGDIQELLPALDGATGAFLDHRIDAHAAQDRARIQRDHRLEVTAAEAVADHHAVRVERWQRRLDDLRAAQQSVRAQLAQIDDELARRRPTGISTVDARFEQITAELDPTHRP